MNALRIYFTLILYLSTISIGISQEIESYKLSINTTYLPIISNHYEFFSKKKSKLKHEARYDGQKVKLGKREISNIITLIDSLSRVDVFKFHVDQSLIDAMKDKYIHYKKENGISNSDIEALFDENNMVSLDTKRVKAHFFEAISEQIDGTYYSIQVELKYKNNKNVEYYFEMQSSTPKNNKIKQWLILYSIFQNEDLFETISIKEACFSDNDFMMILFRFIIWGK